MRQSSDARNWSPTTPAFRDEPWRAEPRMAPDAVAPYLAALKSVVATPHANGQPVDPAMTTRYLEACKRRREVRDGTAF